MNEPEAVKALHQRASTRQTQTETSTESRRDRRSCQPSRLPDKFTSKGFEYTLERRRDSAAIYRQRWLKGTAEAFEVVIPRIANRRFVEGKWQESEPYEVYPSSEQWGRFGWTFTDLDRAIRKLDHIPPRSRRPKLAECDHNVVNNT